MTHYRLDIWDEAEDKLLEAWERDTRPKEMVLVANFSPRSIRLSINLGRQDLTWRTLDI